MLITPLLMSVVMMSPYPAGDPAGPQDGAMVTAPATPVVLDGAEGPTAGPVSPSQAVAHGLSTDDQIAQWLAAHATNPAPFDDAPVWRDDRKPHGEVSVGVGTGDYRDYAVALSLPVGESGRLDLSYRQVENGYPYGYGYGDDYGYGRYGSGIGRSGTRMGVVHGYGEWAGEGEEPSRRRPDAGSQSDRP